MKKVTPLVYGIDPPSERPDVISIDINGREEHEAILLDADKCAKLGLDQMYEKIVYLKRWGGWLKDETTKTS